MRSLKHGCTEVLEDGQEIIHLYDQSGSIPKKQWITLIKNHIKENGNEHLFNELKEKYPDYDDEKREYIAIHQYSWYYNPTVDEVQDDEIKDVQPKFNEILDDMGCNQLTLC